MLEELGAEYTTGVGPAASFESPAVERREPFSGVRIFHVAGLSPVPLFCSGARYGSPVIVVADRRELSTMAILIDDPSPTETQPWHRKLWWWVGFPVLIYSSLSLWMTWPLVTRLGREIPIGVGGDAWVHLWTFHWVETALATGLDPFYTTLLYFPDGASLTTHNIAWLNIALWKSLQVIASPLASYSLMYLVIFALNGCALYWMLFAWTRSASTSCLGGVVYASWPYLLSQTGHPNMIVLMGVPLALLFLWRTIEYRNWHDALFAGFFVALTGIGRWQLLMIAAPLLVFFALYQLVERRARPPRRTLLLLLMTGVVSVLLMAPLITPVITAHLAREHPTDVLVDSTYERGSDLVAYVFPNMSQWTGGWASSWFPSRLRFAHDRVDHIGVITLLLAMVGAWKQPRHARFWLGIALVYVLLALGPDLTLAHTRLRAVPMPYRLFEDNFFMRIIRSPHRFNALLALPVAVLAALGGRAIASRFAGRNRQLHLILIALLALAISTEHWITPYSLSAIEVPDWYDTLGKEPDEFGILELPIHPRNWDKDYMRYQLVHGKPLAQGHVSRPTRETFRFLHSTPFLRMLQTENRMDESTGDVTRQLRTLADANIRYLILHKRLATIGQVNDWRRWLAYSPTHEDDELVVYDTSPRYGRDYTFDRELTDSIGLIAIGSNLATIGGAAIQGEMIEIVATWASRSVPGRPYTACLIFDGSDRQQNCFPLGGSLPSELWTKNEIVRETYAARVGSSLDPGEYELSLGLMDEAGRMAGAVLIGPMNVVSDKAH